MIKIKVRMVTHEGLFISDLQLGTSDIFLSLYAEEVSFSSGNYAVFKYAVIIGYKFLYCQQVSYFVSCFFLTTEHLNVTLCNFDQKWEVDSSDKLVPDKFGPDIL